MSVRPICINCKWWDSGGGSTGRCLALEYNRLSGALFIRDPDKRESIIRSPRVPGNYGCSEFEEHPPIVPFTAIGDTIIFRIGDPFSTYYVMQFPSDEPLEQSLEDLVEWLNMIYLQVHPETERM